MWSHFRRLMVVHVALLAANWANGQSPRPVSLNTSITRVQPMTGIVLWSDNPKAMKLAEAITLEYRYCGYDEFVGADGKYDFSKLDGILDEVSGRKHQAVLRFYFCYVGKQTTVPGFIRQQADYEETVGTSEKKQTHFCDWSHSGLQEFTLDFYTKFAARYDDDPRIAFLQTGFGLWAEYHIYDGPRKIGKTFPSKEFQARFLRHMDDQFDSLPWSISIDSADSDYSPLEDNDELLAIDFGAFDDSFLCKPHPKENAVNWMTLGSDRWKRQPAGGEFSYYNRKDQKNALAKNGPNGVSFEEAAALFHITYMIGNDQPKYQQPERLVRAGMATGYRFRVTAAMIVEDELRLVATNEGVAPIYRDAYFTVGDRRSSNSLRGLLPGQSREFSISGVGAIESNEIKIRCDAILPTQEIQFEANLN